MSRCHRRSLGQQPRCPRIVRGLRRAHAPLTCTCGLWKGAPPLAPSRTENHRGSWAAQLLSQPRQQAQQHLSASPWRPPRSLPYRRCPERATNPRRGQSNAIVRPGLAVQLVGAHALTLPPRPPLYRDSLALDVSALSTPVTEPRSGRGTPGSRRMSFATGHETDRSAAPDHYDSDFEEMDIEEEEIAAGGGSGTAHQPLRARSVREEDSGDIPEAWSPDRRAPLAPLPFASSSRPGTASPVPRETRAGGDSGLVTESYLLDTFESSPSSVGEEGVARPSHG